MKKRRKACQSPGCTHPLGPVCVWGLGFGVWGLGSRVSVSPGRVQGERFRVEDGLRMSVRDHGSMSRAKGA
jgi:hypothetical protein